MKSKCTSVDSIWQYFGQIKDVDKKSEYIMNRYEVLAQKPGLSDSANKLMEKMTNYSVKSPDPVFLCYFYTLKKIGAFRSGDIENAWIWHKKREPFEPFATSNNKLSDYIIVANMLYYTSRPDSAIRVLQSALNYSTTVKDTFYRQTVLINLGSAYYEVGLYGAASNCFTQASRFAFTSKEYRQVLYTNLLASLNAEGKYVNVIQLVKKRKEMLETIPGREDLVELIRLNYLSSLLNLNSSKSLIDEQFRIIESNEIQPRNKSFYIQLKGKKFRKEGDLAGFKKLYTENLSFILENQPGSIPDHIDGFIFGMKNNLFLVGFNQLYSAYNEIKADHTTYLLLSNYASIFSEIKNKEGNKLESINWSLKEKQYLDKLNEVGDDLKNSNIQQEMEKARIMQILEDRQHQIETSQIKQKWLIAASIIFAALLISTALFLFQFNINRKRQLSILKLESELKEKELELLKQNQEKQNSTVFTSKLVLSKIDDVISKIRVSDLSAHPTMVGIKSELERLLEVEIQSEAELSEEKDVFEEYQYLIEKYPMLSDMNQTTYKIFVLSILNNAPKDIANLLNLNMQYVRNVRSKIKKEISENMGENWDWSDLV